MPARRLLCLLFAAFLLLTVGGRPAAADAPPPFVDGWYWDPNYSGMGFSFETHGTTMFLGIYSYVQPDTNFASSAYWYAGYLNPDATGAWVGTVYQYSGGQTLSGTYQPPTGSSPAFTVLLRVTGTNIGSLIFNASANYTLQRFQFGTQLTPASGMPAAGWWWSSAQAGRGWFFEVQGSRLYLAGYMYRDGGTPVWYYANTDAVVASTSSFAGTLRACTGGPLLGGQSVDQTQIQCAISGGFALVYNSSTSATLTLPSATQVPLTRFGF